MPAPELPVDVFESIREATPGPLVVSRIHERLAESRRTTRKLPSDSALTALLLAAFVALVLFLSLFAGFRGFSALTGAQRVAIFAPVVAGACLLAIAVREQVVPGAKVVAPVRWAVLFPLVAMALVVPLVFPEFSTAGFAEQGLPCLRLGLLCVVPGAALAALFLRLGYVTDPGPAAVTGAAFSGWIGFAVLAIHCSVHNASHVLVWHLGVIVVAIAGGGLLASFVSRLRF